MTFQKMVDYIKKRQRTPKILVMGLDNAGKTSLINLHFKLGTDPAPTFGYRTHTIPYGDYEMTLVDIGGQYCFREFWSNYFEKVDGVVFVIDCTDERSCNEYLNEVAGLDVPVCVMANKLDLNREFDVEGMDAEVQKIGRARAFGTSLYEEESVRAGFQWLLGEL